MLANMDRIVHGLLGDTAMYSGHEYTVANLKVRYRVADQYGRLVRGWVSLTRVRGQPRVSTSSLRRRSSRPVRPSRSDSASAHIRVGSTLLTCPRAPLV